MIAFGRKIRDKLHKFVLWYKEAAIEYGLVVNIRGQGIVMSNLSSFR